MTKDNTRTIPSRGSDQYPVRFPDGMRDKIKDAAKANGRSMNAEIIARLEASFATESRTGGFGIPEEVSPGITQASEEYLRKVIREMVEAHFEEEQKAK